MAGSSLCGSSLCVADYLAASHYSVGVTDNAKLVMLVAMPAFVTGILALLFVGFMNKKVMAMPTGRDIQHHTLDRLAEEIRSGAMVFLHEEYKVLAIFGVFVFGFLILVYTVAPVKPDDSTDGIRVAAAFVIGATLSAAAGYFGMLAATKGNVRTTVACITGDLNDGLKAAFATGALMGFTVVGLGLVGLSVVFMMVSVDHSLRQTMQLMTGFGFGASTIALFARVGGGIYTKAADVGADLVGKVEAGIDEDDPRNPAVIADNVGDNVGDIAGMGADLFESFVGSLIAAAFLGSKFGAMAVALPFWLAAAGVVASMVGVFFVSVKKGVAPTLSNLMWALEKGMYVAGILFIIFAAIVCHLALGDSVACWRVYGCILIGLASGMAIGKVTEYFTSTDHNPVISIKDRGLTGPATVAIQGIGVGMASTVPPTLVLVAAILSCAALADDYGVAIAAVGMLSTLGITLATDSFGPVADNAGGLAEMDPMVDPSVREKTDALDALGNTTAATGKGFAIGSAVLTSVSLMAAFKQQIIGDGGGNVDFDVSGPVVLSGLLIGCMLPQLFSALTLLSVSRAAAEIIIEVRRQFSEVKNARGVTLREAIQKASQGLTLTPEEDVIPDSDKCVAISTRSSLREMIAPGAFAIFFPLIVGLLIGPACLMGMLAGGIGCASMMGMMLNNAGGAWDNAKKLCGQLKLQKQGEQYIACIVGDTIGDPFKDTSGPSLNVLSKLLAMVALIMLPGLQVTNTAGVTLPREDWQRFEYGFVPISLCFIVIGILYHVDILTWADPLGLAVDSAIASAPGPADAPEHFKQGVKFQKEVTADTDAPMPAETATEMAVATSTEDTDDEAAETPEAAPAVADAVADAVTDAVADADPDAAARVARAADQ